MTYISSPSLTTPLRQSVLQAQAALTTVQTEISTGKLADVGLSLGAQTGSVLSMSSQVDSLNAFTSANGTASTRLGSTASVLTSMVSTAQSISSDLLTASTTGGDTTSLQTNAQAALQSLISSLNTSVGGQSIFGGINTAMSPLGNYFSAPTSSARQAVDTAFQSAFGTCQTDSTAS